MKSMKVAKEIDYNQTILTDLQGLAGAWSAKKQFDKAFYYLMQYADLNDSLFNQEKMMQLTEMQEKYESEKKEKELLEKDLELSEKEKEAGIQKGIRNFLIAGLLAVVVFATLVFRSYRQKKKANRIISGKNTLLEQANAEILAQRDEIEAQRDEIQAQRDTVVKQKDHIEIIHEEQTSSIRYAQRIQNAMLPSLDMLKEKGLESFLIFHPRNIVSGDFYWVAYQENTLVIAVADCTGHGVPGAFMSMLGIAFLKEIVMKEYITQPDIVLKRLRREVVRSLKQEGGNQRDGMDIALCTLNLDTLEMQFAGANNPLYIVKSAIGHWPLAVGQGTTEANSQQPTANGQLIELKGDKMPIGIHERMDNFTLHTHTLQKGDCIYLFSDGMADQFGGPAGKKFKYKQLKESLTANGQQPMASQKESIDKLFSEWKGHLEQVDDVTILGIKI
jgi:serine phosphatase RsbU (regulator of sigma subunit)